MRFRSGLCPAPRPETEREDPSKFVAKCITVKAANQLPRTVAGVTSRYSCPCPVLVVIVLCYLNSLAFEDALPILPECLCGLVFRFGLAPYHPLCIILKLHEAFLTL